jgi:hypothetical protein
LDPSFPPSLVSFILIEASSLSLYLQPRPLEYQATFVYQRAEFPSSNSNGNDNNGVKAVV